MKENVQERFDGFAVTVYDGKFTGGFDLDDDLAAKTGFDDVVTFVVTGRVSAVAISETKLGDLKRTNTFAVTNAVPLSAKQAEILLDTLGESVNGVNAGQLTIQGAIDGAQEGGSGGGGGAAHEGGNGDGGGGIEDRELTSVGAGILDPAAAVPVNDPVLARFLGD